MNEPSDIPPLNRPVNPLVVIGLMLPLLRAGFIWQGYGVEPDSWRVARCALDLAETGRYEVSRFPGYPLHEFASALLVRFGPAGLNGASALMSMVAFAFFLVSLLRVRARAPLETAAVLLMIPVVFIASVTSKDYVWGLAFILAAHDLVLSGRPRLAGIALGLAIGTRMTHLIMLPPLLLLIEFPHPVRARIDFAVTTLLAGAACFAPVAGTYGFSFLQYSSIAKPSLPLVAYRLGYGVWGLFGMAGVALAVFISLANRRNRRSIVRRLRVMEPRHLAGWLLAVTLPLALFLVLPHQPGYLIPALPFLLLLAARLLPRVALLTLIGCLAAAPFLGGISPGFEPAAERPAGAITLRAGGRTFWLTGAGPAFIDRERRKHLIKIGRQAIRASRTIEPDSVIVAGWWLPQIEMQMRDEGTPKDARFVYALDRKMAEELSRQGVRIYTMPGQAGFNLQMKGFDPASYGAGPLIPGME